MWVSPVQSVEGLKRLTSLEKESILPANSLWSGTAALHWVSILPAYSADVRVTGCYNCISQFLKINLSYIVSRKTFLYYTYRYIFCCVSLEDLEYIGRLHSLINQGGTVKA